MRRWPRSSRCRRPANGSSTPDRLYPGPRWGPGSIDRCQRSALASKQRFSCRNVAVNLPYRSDLPNRRQTESEHARWQALERAALDAGQLDAARDAHAQVERMTRQLARLRSLPDGPSVPVMVAIWQLGDAVWVFLQGEYYSLLQRALRERFPQRPVIVATVTDGWRPGYVPTAETYGRGIYQESIAIVAPGSLESLIDRIGAEIAAMTAP